MKKHLKIGSLKIAYEENLADGPPIVFVHGNSLSSGAFKYQIQSAALSRYQIFALDLPGHGASDWSATPDKAYSLPGYAKVLSQFARELDIQNALFVGWSLGGHVVMEAIPQLSLASGFMVFGAPPLRKPPRL
ncbi:MAG: alpha/beta hydrolase, partial [Bacteroidota bacterium]